MTKPSLFVVFEGQTEGELDSKQNDWLSERENPTHIIKITDELLTAEMSAPPDRFSRSIQYHEYIVVNRTDAEPSKEPTAPAVRPPAVLSRTTGPEAATRRGGPMKSLHGSRHDPGETETKK